MGAMLLLVPLALTAGCGGDEESPTAPAPTVVNETFSGTLAPAGSIVHPFRVSVAGQVDVLLTAVTPNSSLSLTVAVGTWDGTNCTTVTTNTNARQGTIALSGNALTGDFCARISDSGTIPADTTVSYTLQINHS
ncbi:MAG: hypothetical protein AB7I50_13600 [Vicinamibacterales bacterium]